ncbi:MAG: transferrin-binding protein-like solute binding protein [Gammaproteobacteria bacterium]|nr:transferrin-binding protein-like solute binding protein [Gammaproteobacteria bacterium]
MKQNILLSALLAAMLVIAGCGGGSSSDGREKEMMGGKIEDGKPLQTLSEIYQSAITDGEEHTFDMVLSASVLQNQATNNTSIREDNELSVSQIVRNEDGGYDVTYRIDDASNTITFHPSECDEDGGDCYEDLDADDQGAQLWNMHSTVGGILSPSDMAEYHHANHLNLQGTTSSDERILHKQIFVFGVTTPASNQPKTGTGTYYGWFFGYANRMTEVGNAFRQRIMADMQLVANFDMNTINGDLTGVEGTPPGGNNNSWEDWQEESRFEITGTGVNSAGQFTATVTGMDASTADDVESVRGFMGQLTAQLFGPNAEEIGGVLSASRDLDGDDNDLALYGYVSSTKFGPAKILSSEGVSVGVKRNFEESKTELLEQGKVTIMRNASDSGWVLTTDARTVEFEDSDYRSEEGNYFLASAEDDAVDGDYFWTATNGFSATPDYDYFDIKGWANNHDNPGIWVNSFIIHGDRTPISSLPSSTATYYGRMHGREFPSDDAISWISEARRYQGDLTLTADFANTSVTGEITNLETRVGNSGSYSDIQGDARFNASITGHNFTADDFSGTGDISNLQNGNVYGSFFGPTAQEAGGIFDADLGSDVVVGYFGAAQEQ